MTAFKDLPFEARFARMGDEAEAKFEEVYPKGFIRWGINRPPIKVSVLPAFVRGAPDYLTSDGFYDAMGVYKDQLLKLKVEKYVVLHQWHQFWPVSLFVWDSENERYSYSTLAEVTAALAPAIKGSFPEGKVTWEIPLEELAAEWTNT